MVGKQLKLNLLIIILTFFAKIMILAQNPAKDSVCIEFEYFLNELYTAINHYNRKDLYDEYFRLQKDKTWMEKCITNWIYRFEFSGYGSIPFEIKLLNMHRIAKGRLSIACSHIKYGEIEIILDESTLDP